ncbi:hypothetical protein EXIGLDRAFT_728869 [Exidia glandulosa HHB12029]|uniref:Uncharacterized protein n=1 Tax=Exidia glandulosa HHB12029 TaxID=1314781 RepID=A0A165CTY4_EXIGL|nr:hypothetical protein EXIGLDRAFT_728869 [Exidia glandulosa HHB12029]
MCSAELNLRRICALLELLERCSPPPPPAKPELGSIECAPCEKERAERGPGETGTVDV